MILATKILFRTIVNCSSILNIPLILYFRQEDLMDIYPKCYYADDKCIVFENLVVGKGYVLLNKEEQQDFESARYFKIKI